MTVFNSYQKAFINRMYDHGYKIHIQASVWNVSRRTILKILRYGGRDTSYKRNCKNSGDLKQALAQRIRCLMKWISYARIYGFFDLDAACRGEDPS